MKTWPMLALMLVTAGSALPSQAAGRSPASRNVKAEEAADDSKAWIDGKLKDLRRDLDKLDHRLDDYDAKTREDFQNKIGELEQRVSKLEGRMEAVGDRADEDGRKTREDVRDEIKDIRDDLKSLNRRLAHKH